jgi:hypothetical protein
MSEKITIDDIFDHLLCDSKVQKMREHDMFGLSRHFYDRKNQGAVELNDDSMITIDVEDSGITITRYKDGFACEYTEPEGMDEACRHIKHYLEFDELPDGEPI